MYVVSMIVDSEKIVIYFAASIMTRVARLLSGFT